MHRPDPSHTSPPDSGGDGVRIHRKQSPGGGWRRRSAPAIGLALALAAGLQWHLARTPPTTPDQAVPLAGANVSHPRPGAVAPPRAVRRQPVQVMEQEPAHDFELPSQDPDDLAAHFSFNDPVPTMAEVIAGLNDAGIHTGLGAFNPPGTSPPLPGLAVPDDFELPEGFVRHHQVTDDGEPIEPILMFSPDFEFHDESGAAIEIPADRVVPPELAPDGLPLRQVEIPEPSP